MAKPMQRGDFHFCAGLSARAPDYAVRVEYSVRIQVVRVKLAGIVVGSLCRGENGRLGVVWSPVPKCEGPGAPVSALG